MPFDLPAPIARYFLATNAHDADQILPIFSNDALVHDEGRDLQGHAAIRRWVDETIRKYDFTATPTGMSEVDGKIIVPVQVSGTFPGSPVALRYHFAILGEKIARLEVTS